MKFAYHRDLAGCSRGLFMVLYYVSIEKDTKENTSILELSLNDVA